MPFIPRLKSLGFSGIAYKYRNMKKHCCSKRAEAVTSMCNDHKNRFDCPDCLIHYAEKSGEYGIIIHDGGTSFAVIQFCPWCGKRLSRGKSIKEKRMQ